MAGAAAPGPRNAALPADNIIIDAWFALTQAGGGNIADVNLTAINARALYSNN